MHFCGFALHTFACRALMCITSLISDAQFDVNHRIHCSTSEPLHTLLLYLFLCIYVYVCMYACIFLLSTDVYHISLMHNTYDVNVQVYHYIFEPLSAPILPLLCSLSTHCIHELSELLYLTPICDTQF